MTTGKLEFGTKFYGREVEKQQLKDAYLRLDVQPVAVLLGGLAGTGKTRLVEQVLRELKEDARRKKATPFYFCSGKADELLSTDPFSSIVGAIASLAKELAGDEQLKKRILQAVGSEGRVLTQVIPELKEVIGEQPVPQSSSTSTTTRNRFTYLFLALLKAIITPQKPLVLYLDDLQWTDASSLELVTRVLTDPDMTHFLFIGSYRDDEIETGHSLTRALQILREQGRPYLTLTLGNLSRPQAQQLIQDALQQQQGIEPLADAVYRKTLGNVFSLQAALQLLEQRKVLRFVDGHWEWDDLDTDISDNAASMVLKKLFGLEEDLQLVLMTAAYLRSTFNVRVLHELLVQHFAFESDLAALVCLLEQGMSEGLVGNSLGSDMYRFAHDRVRQASLMLAKNEGKEFELGLRVGHFLLSVPEADGLEWMFFAGVDHWNAVPLGLLNGSGCDTFHLASLNLDAGKKASDVAAFAPASSYFRKGVALLEDEPDRWRLQYHLCLDLYSSAAEIEFCIGSYETGELHTSEVLVNACMPVDKSRVYKSKAEALSRKERHNDAIDIYTKHLGMFKEAPKGLNFPGIVRKLYKVKAMYKKLSADDIGSAHELTDPSRIVVIEILNELAIRSTWVGNKHIQIWAALRSCEITAIEGVCEAAILGLSLLAAIFHFSDPPFLDPELGRRVNVAARKLIDRFNAKSMEPVLRFNAACYVDCWMSPLSSIMERLQAGYYLGMETGNFEFAFLDRGAFHVYQFASGVPLEAALEDCTKTSDMLEQYQVNSVAAVLNGIQNMLRDLTGKAMDPFEWTQTDDLPASRVKQLTSSSTSLPWKYLGRSQVAYYLRRYDLAEKALECFEVVSSDDKAYLTILLAAIFRVLVNTARYRETRQRRYKARARNSFRAAEKIRQRTLNAFNKFKLLEADMESTFDSKKTVRVKELFDDAIAESLAGHYIQDAALANELAGEYFSRMEDAGDKFWTKRYLTSAHALYSAWDAKGKVRQLLDRHGKFIDLETSKKLHFTSCNTRITRSIPLQDLMLRGKDDASSGQILSEEDATPSRSTLLLY